LLAANVMLNDGSKTVIAGVFDWSGLKTFNDPARICTDFIKELSDPCLGNATVLPGLEPTLLAALTLAGSGGDRRTLVGYSETIRVKAIDRKIATKRALRNRLFLSANLMDVRLAAFRRAEKPVPW
jgi:hypothetical protein